LFVRTRRRTPRAGERDVLQQATALELAGMKAWSWGRGATVLLVHGWNGRGTQLGGFVAPLVESGYRVVAFDALGHGDSPGRHQSLPEFARDIRAIADELGEIYGVVAHSLGGAATTLAMSQGLRVERAVFVSPPANPEDFLAIFAGALGISNEVRDRVQQRVEARLGMDMVDMRADLLAQSMRTPLLVIHDRDDKEVPIEVGRSIASTWPGAELVVTEGLGHQRILGDEGVLERAVNFIDAIGHLKTAA
jgi:pimeloyl-ACP methyl ester carboxylesterase